MQAEEMIGAVLELCCAVFLPPQVVVLLRPLVLRDVLHAFFVGECDHVS